MTKQEFEQILDQKLAAVQPKVYKTIDDVPDYAKDTVQKLVDQGALAGTGGTTNGKANLNLSYDLVRTLVILDRVGALTPKVATAVAAAAKPASTGAVKANVK